MIRMRRPWFLHLGTLFMAVAIVHAYIFGVTGLGFALLGGVFLSILAHSLFTVRKD